MNPSRTQRLDSSTHVIAIRNGLYKPVVRNVRLENVRSTNSPRVMWIAGFPGAVIDGVSFVDCIFRGVRLVQNRERTGVPARASRVGWWMRPG